MLELFRKRRMIKIERFIFNFSPGALKEMSVPFYITGLKIYKKFSDFIYLFLERIVMYLFECILEDETFNPIGNTFNYFIEILKTFNKICYDIFQFGNVIMFLIFLFMSLNLLLSAREREYKEKINARNLIFLKKRGRIGTVISFF